MLDRPYLKRWPLDPDKFGLTDYVPNGFPLRPELLDQFESIGDNCELGFVQRFHGVEPSSLFRWATAPLHGVLTGLADGWADIYAWENLRPWASDMAWDDKYQCAFHGSMRCALIDGEMTFTLSEKDHRTAWKRDRTKLFHMRGKMLEGLRNPSRIYVAKANAGLALDTVQQLKASLDRYGEHRLLCVVPEETFAVRGLMLLQPGVKLATISHLASYHRVELAAYGEWTNLLQKAVDTPWA